MNVKDAKARQMAPLGTPTDLRSNATQDISGALTTLLADIFALDLKTKDFHWHMSGPRLSPSAGRTGRANICRYRRDR
jgi:starvation-inducible DNA-binding protein